MAAGRKKLASNNQVVFDHKFEAKIESDLFEMARLRFIYNKFTASKNIFTAVMHIQSDPKRYQGLSSKDSQLLLACDFLKLNDYELSMAVKIEAQLQPYWAMLAYRHAAQSTEIEGLPIVKIKYLYIPGQLQLTSTFPEFKKQFRIEECYFLLTHSGEWHRCGSVEDVQLAIEDDQVAERVGDDRLLNALAYLLNLLNLDLKKMLKPGSGQISEIGAYEEFINFYGILGNLQNGASVEAGMTVGNAVISSAAFIKDEVEFNRYLDKLTKSGSSLSQLKNANRQALLRIAASLGFASSVIRLILEKIEVTIDIDGCTPLTALMVQLADQKISGDASRFYTTLNILREHITSADVDSLSSIMSNVLNPSRSPAENENMCRLSRVIEQMINTSYHKRYDDTLSHDFKLVPEFKLSLITDSSMNAIVAQLNSVRNEIKRTQLLASENADKYILQLQDLHQRLIKLRSTQAVNKLITTIGDAVNELIQAVEYRHVCDLRLSGRDDLADRIDLQLLRQQTDEIELSQVGKTIYSKESEIIILKLINLLFRCQLAAVDAEAIKLIQSEIANDFRLLKSVLAIKNRAKSIVTETASAVSYPLGRMALEYARQCILRGNTIMALDSPYITSKTVFYAKEVEEVRSMRRGSDQAYLDLVKDLVRIDPSSFIFNAQYQLDLCKKYSLGNCEEFAMLALDYIVMHNSKLALENQVFAELCRVKNGDHIVLVIGRSRYSKETDVRTWGDAYICDPWSNEIYKAIDYREKLKDYVSADEFHYVRELEPRKILLPVEAQNSVMYGQRNSPQYINDVFNLFKLKLTMLAPILINFKISLIKFKRKIPDILGHDSEFYKLIANKIARIDRLSLSLESVNSVDLPFLYEKIKESKQHDFIDNYTFIKSELHDILKSLIQQAMSLQDTHIKDKSDYLDLFPGSLDRLIGGLIVDDYRSCIDEYTNEIMSLGALQLTGNDYKSDMTVQLRRSGHSTQADLINSLNSSGVFSANTHLLSNTLLSSNDVEVPSSIIKTKGAHKR
jgi:hypothetical protein